MNISCQWNLKEFLVHSRIICETRKTILCKMFCHFFLLCAASVHHLKLSRFLSKVSCKSLVSDTNRWHIFHDKKEMGLLGSCFCRDDFFIQVIQVHFNHCHQLSAVHKTRRRHAVPVDSFNEIDTEFGGNSPPEASKATVVIWFPWNYSPPTTPHQAHQGSLRLQPTPKDLSLEQNA